MVDWKVGGIFKSAPVRSSARSRDIGVIFGFSITKKGFREFCGVHGGNS